MASPASDVSNVLSHTGARLWRKVSVACGLDLAEWEWRGVTGWANYVEPAHHTLSLYLEGGDKIVRVDREMLGGAPDKFCLMPAGQTSSWRVGGPIRVLHLYIEPAALAYHARSAFGLDQRQIDLQDLTFVDDPAIAMIVRGGILSLDWTDAADRIALDSACHLLLHRLLRHYNACTVKNSVKGGLAPSVQRNLAEYIDANLSSSLTIEALAQQANLSMFHFAKMFRVSMGQPPHGYVAKRRVERAKQLLIDSSLLLADIALQCGYASQSHFTRAFKGETGTTPGAWRNSR